MIRCIEIVSGGQTGVDRGALDAALAAGVACGGWCPTGRMAEDGAIPDRYPVRELLGGYEDRTRMNVEDSDGTLIIHFGAMSGGTLFTHRVCDELNKPVLTIDASNSDLAAALAASLEFLDSSGIERLNVAGPRASGDARGYAFARDLVGLLLQVAGTATTK